MAEFQYKAGLNHVGSYQVSGIPYVSGNITAPSSSATPISITFPSVTQRFWVHVGDKTNKLRVGFSELGVKNGNYFIVDGDSSNNTSQVQEFRVRCDKIFLLSNISTSNVDNISVMAELSGITLNYSLASVYSGSAGIG